MRSPELRKKKEMRQGIQNILSEIGEAGCFALCICELGKPGLSEGEAVDTILEGIARGSISYDPTTRNNPNNLFVLDRDGLMDLVSGQKGWKSTTEKPDYLPKDGERIIECWRWNERIGERIISRQHFKLPSWDAYKDSRTVRYGYLESLRVFRRKEA